MKYNKTLAVSFAAIATMIAGGLVANAASTGSFQNFGFAKKQFNHQQVMEAIESGDYSTWLEVVGSGSPVASEVTEGEFPTLVRAHELGQEARELRESIGLTRGFGMHNPGDYQYKNFHMGYMGVSPEQREAAMTALENNDYNAWTDLVAGTKLEGKVSEENFNKMAAAYDAFQSGDYEAAREIKDELRDELGFPGKWGHKMGQMGFGRNQQ